jgi:hypothetical protein
MNQALRKTFAVYVFAYSFFFASRPLSDGDFWFHLKTGEYIIRTRQIPRTDLFSFTNYGKPWIAHEWLSEAIFYVVYSRLGFNALIFIFAIISALAFWIAFKRSESHPFIGGFAALLGVSTVLPNIGVRPRVLTLLLASVYLYLLARYARRPLTEPGGVATGSIQKAAQHRPSRAIWWLVPLMALWANLHGGFLIGLVLIGLTIVGIPLDAWAVGEKIRPLWPRLRVLGLVLVCCLLVAILNPHGTHIYRFPFEIFLSPIQQQAIVDWLSPNFHEPELLPLALLILLTIAALALSPTKARPSELLLFLTTLYATLKSNRHMVIFALVAVPLMAEYLHNWLTSTSFGKALGQPPSPDLNRRAVLVSVLLLLPLAAFAVRLKATAYAPPKQEMINVPLNAVEFLKEKQITGNTFTDPNIWGGYLIWKLPSNPVYIDGRIDMYGDQFVKEYLGIIWGVTDWRGPFDRYGVRIVIVRPRSPLGRQLNESSDWQRVFQDDMAVVFIRR